MKWTIESSRVLMKDRFLTLRVDRCITPAGHTIDPYYVLEGTPWVNVVALTSEGDCLLVQQYRHAVAKVVHGLPAGGVEPADLSPLEAARRELLEETGHQVSALVQVLEGDVNPASQTHSVSTFLALDAEPLQDSALDAIEDTRVVKVPFRDLFLGTSALLPEIQIMHRAALWAAGMHLIQHPEVFPALRQQLISGLNAEDR